MEHEIYCYWNFRLYRGTILSLDNRLNLSMGHNKHLHRKLLQNLRSECYSIIKRYCFSAHDVLYWSYHENWYLLCLSNPSTYSIGHLFCNIFSLCIHIISYDSYLGISVLFWNTFCFISWFRFYDTGY